MNRKDNCTPFNSFEDSRKSLVRHTIQYFVMYSFGSVLNNRRCTYRVSHERLQDVKVGLLLCCVKTEYQQIKRASFDTCNFR